MLAKEVRVKRKRFVALILIFIVFAFVVDAQKPNEEQSVDDAFAITASQAKKLSKKEKRAIVVTKAQKLLKTPYKSNGTTEKGFDCSGFTRYVYKSVAMEIPHSSIEQSEMGKKVRLRNAKPGDLIFFCKGRKRRKNINHVAIVLSNDKNKLRIIHATTTGVSIDEEGSHAWNDYWESRIYGLKRIIK